MNDWIETLIEMQDEHAEVMLVTVAAVKGSAPREAGARMIVTTAQSVGTIGGGQLEFQCTRIAAECLRDAPANSRFRRRFPLGAELGQCCGGVVEVLFERIRFGKGGWFAELCELYKARERVVMVTTPDTKFLVTATSEFASSDNAMEAAIVSEARSMLHAPGGTVRVGEMDGASLLIEVLAESGIDIAIFGAGHVGSACVAALSRIDCRIRWIDSRRNVFPPQLPDSVTRVDTASPAREVAAMPPGAYYLVMTHSHPLDYDICHEILKRDDFAYCGLIGSRAKRQRFSKVMRNVALPAEALERLTCPIGISGISGKRPEDIAIAVTAQLLQVRDAVSRGQSTFPAGRTAKAYSDPLSKVL